MLAQSQNSHTIRVVNYVTTPVAIEINHIILQTIANFFFVTTTLYINAR